MPATGAWGHGGCMMKFRENEDAVSPVIGVILMVAITVILAAVIAAFVFGMAGNIQSTKSVAATATQQGKDIIVTYQGGPDAGDLVYIAVSVTPSESSGSTIKFPIYYSADNAGTVESATTMSATEDGVPGKIPVGSSWEYGNGTSGRDHVVVAAHFADGSDQVILDTFV